MVQVRGEKPLRMRARPSKHTKRLPVRNRVVGEPIQPPVPLRRTAVERVGQE